MNALVVASHIIRESASVTMLLLGATLVHETSQGISMVRFQQMWGPAFFSEKKKRIFFLMQQEEFKTPTEYIVKQRKKSLRHDLQETKKERKKIQNETRINQSNLSILLTEVCVLP